VIFVAVLLEARDIGKAYPGVQALKGVSVQLHAGEVVAVVGENGAGKSTLMKILGGVERADRGDILVDSVPAAIDTVEDAEQLGIVLIHQELNLVDSLDVAGNIFLGREPRWGGVLGLLDRRIYPRAAEIMRRVGLGCSPRTRVDGLPVSQQQLVEIARALSLKSRVLIMDEPTASLTQHEIQRLFEIIRELKNQGVGILYVSHRLKEVVDIADRVLVLRDGAVAGELPRADIHHDAIIRLMVGRDLKQFFQRTQPGNRRSGQPLLRVNDVRYDRRQRGGISFELWPGEIVSMAGLVGAGRTELAEALFGVRPLLAGEIALDGRAVSLRSPAEAIAAGIVLVPEDRRLEGLVLSGSVVENVTLPSLAQVSRAGLLSGKRERDLAQTMCSRLGVRTPSLQQIVGLLSGGNQQKVVLAKWLTRTPRVLILDEPTRGIDVGAKTEIYALMDRLSTDGVAILMISSDLEEILGMSDRVLVMHERTIAGELARGELTEEAIMRLAVGRVAHSTS
jgi:ribose transport system ATP-binding protein